MEKEVSALDGFKGLLDPAVPFAGGAGGNSSKMDSDVYGEELSDDELNALIGKPTPKAKEEDDEDDTPDELKFDEPEPEKKKPGRPKKEKKVIEESEEDDDDEEEDEDLQKLIEKKAKESAKKDKEKPSVTIEEEELDDPEKEAVTSFFGVIADKMGWDIEEDEEVPTTAEELVDYFADIIEKQSVPQYANEELQKLDEFVRNGGNIRDYVAIDADVDLDTIDIEDNDESCKLVIKEFLKEKGFTKPQIDKKITKYEQAGLLSDEAEDALEALKEIKTAKKEQLLAEKQKEAETIKANQQKMFTDVVTQIKGLTDIRGVKIPQKDKQALIEYIFKPVSEGKTKYHQDYQSNYIKNLIESAYFTMNGSTLLEMAKQEGSNSALDKFKSSLNTKKNVVSKKTKKEVKSSGDDMSIWGNIARHLGSAN